MEITQAQTPAATETPLPFRHPTRREQGVRFIDWLDEQVGGDRRRRQRLVAFLEEWSHLADERGPITVEEYAERWRVPLTTSYRLLNEFRAVLPGEIDPGRVMEFLWDGTAREQGDELPWLLAVRVVPR